MGCLDVCAGEAQGSCNHCVVICTKLAGKCIGQGSNPAATFCICMGGEYETRVSERGEYGICTQDGNEMPQWTYYYGTLCKFLKDECPGYKDLNVTTEQVCR